MIVTSTATAPGARRAGARAAPRACRCSRRRRPRLAEDASELAEHLVFRPAARRGFRVERLGDGAFRVAGDAVERLIARHDLENEEALAHVEHRLRAHRRDPRARGGGLRAGRRRRDRRRRLRARPGVACRAARMARAVVKLGSTVVADERRRAARGRARAHLRARSPRCTRAGVEVVIVTSGAIARGMRRAWTCRCARRAIEELQAASAVGQGKLYRVYDELLRERGVHDRAGAADVLRHERAHALPQRAPDAAEAARLARRAGRSTRTTRPPPTRSPSATTTSSPRRWRCWSAPTCCVLLTDTDGLYTADPRSDPDAQLVDEVDGLRGARARWRSAHDDLAAGLGRHALEGRRGRDGDRGGDPDGDLQRAASRARWPRRSAGERGGTRFAARGARATRASSCG